MVRGTDESESAVHAAARTTDWQNFNVALSHNDIREYAFAGGRVVVKPDGATVVAGRPLVVLNPRTWQTFEERFFQFFYRFPVTEPEPEQEPGEAERNIILDSEQSWLFPFSESDLMIDEPGPAAPGD
jgi:hypothetical protein